MKSMIIDLPKILDRRGNLSFIEGENHIPFAVERTYWIYDVPGGEVRGGHTYRKNEEFIIALSGLFDVLLQCCADYVVCTDNPKIKIGLPELKIGLTIDQSMVELLSYKIDNRHTFEKLLYDGSYISHQESRKIGFIDEIADARQAKEIAISKLDSLTRYNQISIQNN